MQVTICHGPRAHGEYAINAASENKWQKPSSGKDALGSVAEFQIGNFWMLVRSS
jgi:hypothetical protein